jgi:hypothetical protein
MLYYTMIYVRAPSRTRTRISQKAPAGMGMGRCWGPTRPSESASRPLLSYPIQPEFIRFDGAVASGGGGASGGAAVAVMRTRPANSLTWIIIIDGFDSEQRARAAAGVGPDMTRRTGEHPRAGPGRAG